MIHPTPRRIVFRAQWWWFIVVHQGHSLSVYHIITPTTSRKAPSARPTDRLKKVYTRILTRLALFVHQKYYLVVGTRRQRTYGRTRSTWYSCTGSSYYLYLPKYQTGFFFSTDQMSLFRPRTYIHIQCTLRPTNGHHT